MKFLLGTKTEMTQIFDDQGLVQPVTVVRVVPNTVSQLKTSERDGYQAVQVKVKGLVGKKESRREYAGEAELGATLDVGIFAPGDEVAVSGRSKAKGFQGVVKRHGFHGGSRTHGQKHSEREPGSISGGARAGGRVAKGMRMAGRMGGGRVTVKNLKVLAIDKDKNQLLISGAVPGRRGTILEIRGK